MNAPPKMTARESGVEAGVEWPTVDSPIYGAINGYVRIPEGHAWSSLAYDEINVSAPGGLTYGHGGGWIGFDTLHSGDCWPGSPDYQRADPGATLWTPEMVAEATRALARSVACCEFKCKFCGCCEHSPQGQWDWCKASKAPAGMFCPERGCGCEGKS